MVNRAKIESILRAELHRAIRCQIERAREYHDVLLHVSHEHSSSEDAEHLQQAYLAEMKARNDTWRAAQRLSDLENYGWIPEDLEVRTHSAGM